MDTEGLHIAILVEIRSLAAIRVNGDNGAIVLPECREGT